MSYGLKSSAHDGVTLKTAVILLSEPWVPLASPVFQEKRRSQDNTGSACGTQILKFEKATDYPNEEQPKGFVLPEDEGFKPIVATIIY